MLRDIGRVREDRRLTIATPRTDSTERDGGTRMEMHLRFESREDMEKLMSTGIVDGSQQAVGQIDALLG